MRKSMNERTRYFLVVVLLLLLLPFFLSSFHPPFHIPFLPSLSHSLPQERSLPLKNTNIIITNTRNKFCNQLMSLSDNLPSRDLLNQWIIVRFTLLQMTLNLNPLRSSLHNKPLNRRPKGLHTSNKDLHPRHASKCCGLDRGGVGTGMDLGLVLGVSFDE